MAFLYEVVYDVSIAKNLSAGASLMFLSGNMHSYYHQSADGYVEKVELESGQAEALSHIGLSIGLRYNL